MRINIARAAYSTEPTVLLDESLVGLDASVLRKVFVRCIQGMMSDRTRVLVSKDAHVIRLANRVVLVDQGRICQDFARHDLKQMKRLRSEEDVATALLRMATRVVGQSERGREGNDDDAGRAPTASSRQQHDARQTKVQFQRETNDDDTLRPRHDDMKTARGDLDDERQAMMTARTGRRARLDFSSRAAPPPSITPLGTPFRVPWDVLETTRQALTSSRRHKSYDVQLSMNTSRRHRRQHSFMTTTSEVDDDPNTDRSHAVSTWRHHHYHQAMGNENVAAARYPSTANDAMQTPLMQYTQRGEGDVEDFTTAHEALYRATWQTYAVYLSRGGVVEWVFAIVLILSAQISIAVSEFLLSRWAQSQLDSGNSSESSTYLTLYGTIVVVYAGCLLMASFISPVSRP